MPYIKDKTQGYGEQAGVLGSGAVPTGRQATQAGSPGSFTNIQDYLSGVTTPKIQGQLENKAQSDIKNAQQNVNQQVQGLSALPQAQQYNPESFQKNLQDNDYSAIRQGATQSYTPTDVTKEIQTPTNPFANVQPGSFSSLMQYFGQTQKPNTQYGQGAQKLDEMLLRGQPEYVQNFAPQKQEQFKSQVEGGVKKAQEERGAAQKATQEQVSKSSADYQKAISDYLGGVNQQAQDKLKEQQAQEAQYTGKSNAELLNMMKNDPQYYQSLIAMQGGANIDPGNYVTRTGYNAPDIGTAAYALGNDTLSDYSALNDILGNKSAPLVGTQAYNPGVINFDQGAYNNALSAVMNPANPTGPIGPVFFNPTPGASTPSQPQQQPSSSPSTFKIPTRVTM